MAKQGQLPKRPLPPPSEILHYGRAGTRRSSLNDITSGGGGGGSSNSFVSPHHPPPPTLPPVVGGPVNNRRPSTVPRLDHERDNKPPNQTLPPSSLLNINQTMPTPAVPGSLLQRPDPSIRQSLVVPPGVAPSLPIRRDRAMSLTNTGIPSSQQGGVPTGGGNRRGSIEGSPNEGVDHGENGMRAMSWSERVDVTFEAGSPVGITFEWHQGVLEVASFTKISPARDSSKISLGMVLTAIDGMSILSMSQREVLGAMQAVARNRRTLTFCLPLSKAPPPPSSATLGGNSSAATKSRRGPGWTKADALQPLSNKDPNHLLAEDAFDNGTLSDSSDLSDEEDGWPITELPNPHRFELLDSDIPSQPEFRKLYRRKRSSKYFLRKYKGLFPEFDDVSTPARRRRIIHEVAKFAYIHYRSTACYNVLQWRKENKAATKIQVQDMAPNQPKDTYYRLLPKSNYRRLVTQRWYKEALRVHKLNAAVVVQKWVRRYLSQLVACQIRLDQLIERQGLAAAQIQAAVRLKLARNAKERRLEQLKTERLRKERAASTIQKTLQRQVSLKKEAAEELQRSSSTIKIQAEFRRHQCQIQYKQLRVKKLKHIVNIQRVFRGFRVRQTRIKCDAAQKLTRWAKNRLLPALRASRRELLLAQQQAEEEEHRQRYMEKGRLVAEEAAEIARLRMESHAQVQDQMPSHSALIDSSSSIVPDDSTLDIPEGVIAPGQTDPILWAPSTESLIDSLDLLATRIDTGSIPGTMDLHSLDPFKETAVIEMLVQMERGFYPNLAVCFDDVASLHSGVSSVALYMSLLVNSSATKIQRGVRDWRLRKESAAGCISRGLKTAHYRRKAHQRARSLSGSTVALQALVRCFLARARTRQLRLARLTTLSRHLEAKVNSYKPCFLTPALLKQRRHALSQYRDPSQPVEPLSWQPTKGRSHHLSHGFWARDVLKLSEPPPGCLRPGETWDNVEQVTALLPQLHFRFSSTCS